MGLKEKIFKLYESGKTYREINRELGCSKGTISYHLHSNKDQERLKRNEWIQSIKLNNTLTKPEFFEKYKDLLSKREMKELCKGLFHKESSKYKSNSAEYHRKRRKEIKLELIKYKGGKCQKCGYLKCHKALQFHHQDPTKKDFAIGENMKSIRIENLKKELDKCILVCANCHSEIHNEIYKE